MALSLSAEQKNLKNIFMNDDRYIVPPYQRPYSWTQEQCSQLYEDITNAFEEGDSYFLGNIVLASKVDNEQQEIVDGQQRLITLWLFVKALSTLLPTLSKIRRMLWVDSWEEAEENKCKIISEVIESNNQEDLNRILQYTEEDYSVELSQLHNIKEFRYKDKRGTLATNAVVIYGMFKEFFSRIEDSKKKDFWEFFSTQVFLLPIILSDVDIDKARARALTIFETINNRGMDLQDADIFKARLYEMSLRVNEATSFIEKWQEITTECDDLNINVDDLFRYYYQIIRGRERIITAEKGLRDFFQNDKFSPFFTGNYQNIMDSLHEILEVLKLVLNLRNTDIEIAKWLQVLYAYTNQYPQYAFIVYLFFNKDADEKKHIEFIKKIIRYCYGKGSTTTIKFEIYSIISKIACGEVINDYYLSELKYDMVKFPGRLTKGLSLLFNYLENSKDKVISSFCVEKILKSVDQRELNTWNNECFSSLANYIVLDRAMKSTSLSNRISDYQNSTLSYVRKLFSSGNYSKEDFELREQKIQKVLMSFFMGNEEY